MRQLLQKWSVRFDEKIAVCVIAISHEDVRKCLAERIHPNEIWPYEMVAALGQDVERKFRSFGQAFDQDELLVAIPLSRWYSTERNGMRVRNPLMTSSS